MMAGSGAGRAMIAPLALLNFCMFMIVNGIAGWALNRLIDRSLGNAGGTMAPPNTVGGNGSTIFLLIFALIAGVVGVASTLAGLAHMALWKMETLAAAIATAFSSWLLTLLAFGLACKEIHSSRRDRRLIALESFLIILGGTHLLYLILLHVLLGTRSTREPGYGGEPHTKGAPAAAAV